jgi:hypothetical protein
MREIIFFFDMQSIHIGTQRNRSVARDRPFEGADHPGSRNTAIDRDPKGLEELGNQCRSIVLFKRGFRMGVNPMPPVSHLPVKISDPIDDRH